MYLCMYARCGSGEGFAAAERTGEVGDVFAEFGAAEVVDVEGGDDGVEDDLTARAMRLSLETAAQENEERDIALAIERSKEECVPGSGTGVATSASSSSVDQLESEPRSGEGRTGRPLRRWDGNVDISVFEKSKPLRRRDAMIGMDDLLLSKSFRRLGLGDQCALESILEDGEDGGSNLGLGNVTGDQGSVVRREGVASGTFVPSPVAVGCGVSSVAVGRGESGTPVPSSAVDEGIENMGALTFGPRHPAYDRKTFHEVYDTDKKFVRFVLDLPKPWESSRDLWLFQKYCRLRERGCSDDIKGDESGRRLEVSAAPSSMADSTAVATTYGARSNRGSTRKLPRRTKIAGMGDFEAESKYVEREMEKRDFQLVRGVWQGGVRLEGDPEDDAQLELFLRKQYQTLQSDAWGVGRRLGGK